MDPFSGQRWSTITPERIAWHAFTVGVLALLLVVLLVSVQTLGDPPPVASPAPEGVGTPAPDMRAEPAARRTRDRAGWRAPGACVPDADAHRSGPCGPLVRLASAATRPRCREPEHDEPDDRPHEISLRQATHSAELDRDTLTRAAWPSRRSTVSATHAHDERTAGGPDPASCHRA